MLAGQQPKRGKFLKGDSVSVVGAAQKKILADITNKGQPKHYPAPVLPPPSTDVSFDLILKVYIHNNVILLLLLIDWLNDDYHYTHGYFEFVSQENEMMRKLLGQRK